MFHPLDKKNSYVRGNKKKIVSIFQKKKVSIFCFASVTLFLSAFEGKTGTLLDTNFYYRTASTKSKECQKYILLIHHYIIISTLDQRTLSFINVSWSRRWICRSLLLCQPSDLILPNAEKMLDWTTRKWPVKLTLLVFTFKRNLFLLPFIILSCFQKYNMSLQNVFFFLTKGILILNCRRK